MRKIRSQSGETGLSPLLAGQHWLLLDKRVLQVGHVGRLLAHHRIMVPWLKRGTPRRQVLTSIKELKTFLHANEATLVENAP